MPEDDSSPRAFAELRDSGLLWLINTTVLHPRGYALALHLDDETGDATGWSLLGDGTEPWVFRQDPDLDGLFAAVTELLAPRSEEG